MTTLLMQEIKKIQDKALKKRLTNLKKTLNPEKAIEIIKSWRNWRVAFRVFVSILTVGLFPLIYYGWASKKQLPTNWVTIPIQKTQAAIEGIQQLMGRSGDESEHESTKEVEESEHKASKEEGDEKSEHEALKKDEAVESEHDSIRDSESHENSEKKSSSSRSSVSHKEKGDEKFEHKASKKYEAVKSEHNSLQDSESHENSEKKSSSSKSSVSIDEESEKQDTNKYFRPKTVVLKFSEKNSHDHLAPQISHNGLITIRCGKGSNVYFSTYEIQRDTIVSTYSYPADHGGEIVSFYPAGKSPIPLSLQSFGIRSGNTTWETIKLSVIPRFFVPLLARVNYRGESEEAVSIFHHRKNHIALNRLHQGKSKTQEIRLSDNDTEDTVLCASVSKNKIFVGHSDGNVSVIELNTNDFSVVNVVRTQLIDQAILSIAVDDSGRSCVILLADGSVHQLLGDKFRKLDLRISNPSQTTLGFRNEDLLIASPSQVIVAKNIVHESINLLAQRCKQPSDILGTQFAKKDIIRKFELGKFFIIFTEDLKNPSYYNIYIADRQNTIQEFLFKENLSNEPHLLRPFFSPSGHLAFYYLNNLSKEIQFLNRVGQLLGSVRNFKASTDSKIVIENFEAQRGTGSKIHLNGSFTVTQEFETTRYDFTELNCTVEKVVDPAVAYSKVLGGSKDKIPRPDGSFVWATSTEYGDLLGCNRIRHHDGSSEYVVGLWPERINHVDMRPKHLLFHTKNKDIKHCKPLLTKEGKWNFFGYNNESIFIYDFKGELLVKIDRNNADLQLIPTDISTNEENQLTVTVLQIYKSRQLQLIKFENSKQTCLYRVDIDNISTAIYDSEYNDIYLATTNHILYKYNLSTGQAKSVALTDCPNLKDTPITKIVMNGSRELLCLRFAKQKIRTYHVDFEAKEASNVGWAYVDNADVFDMHFMENDIIIKYTTTIGSNDALNLLSRFDSNKW